jgi:acyl-coenzyme A synthetase/AMP-(fatty) acid ligase
MQDAGVTVLDTVPTLLGLLGRDVPSLRLINLGGEVLPSALVERWWRPGRRILNSDGPSETTIGATVAELKPGEPVTIGRPNANCSCYIVNEDLLPAPAGTPGELLIGGPGVTKGYIGRPELTAEKFIPNPFGNAGTDPVLHRSGDTVSLDQSGNIVFHGRLDGQVKIRGFRVELGEVEAKLIELPGVAQAAVLVCRHDGLDHLIGFLVPKRGQRLDTRKIKLDIGDKLPAYMVPSQFEVIDALPRLASGKIDRNSLRDMGRKPAEAEEEHEAARSETEAALSSP